MKSSYLRRLILIFLMASPLANAASVDLTTANRFGDDSGLSFVTANYAEIHATSYLDISAVADVLSFEWKFNTRPGTAGFAEIFIPGTFPNNYRLVTVGRFESGGTTGWQTYHFATPYSGELLFSAQGTSTTAYLEIMNVLDSSVSPVPELETWSMLAAGLGLMGYILRQHPGRRRQAARGALKII